MTPSQQLMYYKDFGVSPTNHPAYWEAKEKSRSMPDYSPIIINLYHQAIHAHIEEAEAASSAEWSALFYAKALSILKPHQTQLHSVNETLYKIVRQSEADACRRAADEASSPSDKALWHYFTAFHLAPEPIYIYSRMALNTLEAVSLAARSWETLGDLYKEHNEEIKIPFRQRTFSINEILYEVPYAPKYNAVASYINAFYDLAHTETQPGSQECQELMPVIDKAIATLESIDITASDFQNNAHHFDLLARAYQSKLSVLRSQHRDQPFENPTLQAKIFELRLESARRFEKTITQDPEENRHLHYHRAVNLREAALYASSEEEETKLILLAAESAKEYRLYRGLPIEMTSRESSSERDAAEIMREARSIVQNSGHRHLSLQALYSFWAQLWPFELFKTDKK